MSSNQSPKGGISALAPELCERLREAARARGLPETLAQNPQAVLMALADLPGSGDFSSLAQEISKALGGLDLVAKEKAKG